jgi:hypothetical protein
VQYPAIIGLEAEVVETKPSLDIVRDSDDNKFIECAIAGDADYAFFSRTVTARNNSQRESGPTVVPSLAHT